MIRERQLTTVPFQAGTTQPRDLMRDGVYHSVQVRLRGQAVSTQGVSGTGGTIDPDFPFSLIRTLRITRNGSDFPVSMSGRDLAYHHYLENKAHPHARLYRVASNVETLLTQTVRGVVVPANSDGIGARVAAFAFANAPSSTDTIQFEAQFEIMFQNPNLDDGFYSTCIDARRLAGFQVEILWDTAANLVVPGTAETVTFENVQCDIMAMDQDDLPSDVSFGTYKRSSLSPQGVAYSSGNIQVLLPRGNFFSGLMMGTRAFKSGSAIIPRPENAVLGLIQNRINSSVILRQTSFEQLQAKNVADKGGRTSAFAVAGSGPQGRAFIDYSNVYQIMRELQPTMTMDTFDLLLNTRAIGDAMNGATTGGSAPVIDLVISEVIPGEDMGPKMPRASQGGSFGAGTTAKPYA